MKKIHFDGQFMMFYASMTNFLSQYLGKIRGQIFSTLEEIMWSNKYWNEFAEQWIAYLLLLFLLLLLLLGYIFISNLAMIRI